MHSKKDGKNPTVLYYGKKTYYLSDLVARKELEKKETPQYDNEDCKGSRAINPNTVKDNLPSQDLIL